MYSRLIGMLAVVYGMSIGWFGMVWDGLGGLVGVDLHGLVVLVA